MLYEIEVRTTVMKMHVLLAGLFVALLSIAGPAISAEKVLQCTGTFQGAPHTLKLKIRNDRVVGFSYHSMNPRPGGGDCEVAEDRYASKSEEADYGYDIEWQSWPRVDLIRSIDGYRDPKDSTMRISIVQTASGYELSLEPGERYHVCGVNSYIAPTVILRKGSKTCTFLDSEQ